MKQLFQPVHIGVLPYLVTLICALFPFILSAATPVNENYTDEFNIVYVLYDDNTAVLTNGKSPTLNANSEIRIASPINYNGQEYIVERIEDNAFQSPFQSYILSIKIDKGIKTIGASAFKNCTRLTSVYLPESLETIDGSAFDGCTALKAIYCSSYALPAVKGGQFTGVDLKKATLFVSENYSDIFSSEGSPFASCKEIKEVSSSTLETKRPEMMIDKSELIFTPGETRDLHITFVNSLFYIGMQVDLFLPTGLTITETNGNYDAEIKSSDDGTNGIRPCDIYMNKVENGSYRIIAHPSNPERFRSITIITLKIATSADFQEGEIWFRDLVASDSNGKVTAKDKVYLAEIPEVPVESVTLDKTSLPLQVTQTATLSPTINPSGATKKKLTWTSSDPSVATVSSEGVVTAVAIGSTTVTATSTNGKTAFCVVTVEPTPASSVTISRPSSSSLKPGEKLTLSASVLPVLTTDKTIKWSSSDPDVATVNSEGVVTALKAGTAEITATCGTVSDKISVIILKLIDAISIKQNEISVERDREIQLSAVISPEKPDLYNLEWSSSDEKIAKVDSSGKVSCLIPGNAVITVKDTETGISAICKVTVTDIMYGDANNDGFIVIGDVQLIIDYILERNPKNFVKDRADLDRDGIIDIFDVTKTLELVMSQTPESVSLAHAAMNTRSSCDVVSFGAITADNDGGVLVPVRLNSTEEYKALQFDMTLPEGWTVSDVTVAASTAMRHTLRTAQLSGNTIRIAVYSLSGASLELSGSLLQLKLHKNDTQDISSDDYLRFTNTIGSLADNQGIAIEDINVSLQPVSGVDAVDAAEEPSVALLPGGVRVKAAEGERIEVISIAGMKVVSSVATGEDVYYLEKGMYIVLVGSRSFKVSVTR